MSFRQKIDLFFIDYDLIPLLIQENYLSSIRKDDYSNKKNRFFWWISLLSRNDKVGLSSIYAVFLWRSYTFVIKRSVFFRLSSFLFLSYSSIINSDFCFIFYRFVLSRSDKCIRLPSMFDPMDQTQKVKWVKTDSKTIVLSRSDNLDNK